MLQYEKQHENNEIKAYLVDPILSWRLVVLIGCILAASSFFYYIYKTSGCPVAVSSLL